MGDQGAPISARTPIAPRLTGATATADPTALPGNGARVVPRPTGGTRRQEDRPAAEQARSEAAGSTDAAAVPEDSNKQGEASRGR
jgi:two-component system sensor histidine kinase MtrB